MCIDELRLGSKESAKGLEIINKHINAYEVLTLVAESKLSTFTSAVYNFIL